MIGLDKFILMGTVQRTEIVMQSIRDNKEAVDVYLSVVTYKRGTHDYRVGVFLDELVETAKALHPGQKILIGGRLVGGSNGKFYNVWLNAEYIFLLTEEDEGIDTPTRAEKRAAEREARGSDPREIGYAQKTAYVPPRNGREAVQQQGKYPLADEDIPF